jgi:hypothetical protein
VFEWDNAAAYNISFTGEEQQLVLALAAMLRQFAAQGYISWPRFDLQTSAFTQVQVSTACGTRRSRCLRRTAVSVSDVAVSSQAPTPLPSIDEGVPECALWEAAPAQQAARSLPLQLWHAASRLRIV